jgi:hypothetical protein
MTTGVDGVSNLSRTFSSRRMALRFASVSASLS